MRVLLAFLHIQIQESSSPTQTREGLNQLQHSPEHDELIDIFVQGAGVTRDVATIYLTESNWNVQQALTCLLKETGQVQASEEGETGSFSW